MPAAVWRSLIADLAFINHWPLGEIERMPVSKLRAYHVLAVERVKEIYGKRRLRHG